LSFFLRALRNRISGRSRRRAPADNSPSPPPRRPARGARSPSPRNAPRTTSGDAPVPVRASEPPSASAGGPLLERDLAFHECAESQTFARACSTTVAARCRLTTPSKTRTAVLTVVSPDQRQPRRTVASRPRSVDRRGAATGTGRVPRPYRPGSTASRQRADVPPERRRGATSRSPAAARLGAAPGDRHRQRFDGDPGAFASVSLVFRACTVARSRARRSCACGGPYVDALPAYQLRRIGAGGSRRRCRPRAPRGMRLRMRRALVLERDRSRPAGRQR